MKKHILLFLLLSSSFLWAQVPKSMDSLKVFLKTKPKDTTYVLALNEYAFLLVQEGKMDEAKKTISQMDKLSKKYNFANGYCKVVNMRGVVEYSNQNPEKAMEYFLEARKIIEKYKLPKKFYQNSLNNIGIIYEQMGDRENTTKYAIKLINFQEKNNLKPLKTSPYLQLGSNLKFYKKYDEALKYFNKGLALEIEYKSLTGIAIAENNIGNLYDDLEKNKEAIQHYEAGLKSAEEAEYKLLQTDLLINLGRMYRKENDYTKAEKYFRKAEQICIELEVTKPLKSAYQGLGDLYFFQKKYGLSEEYYLKSLEIAKTIEDIQSLYTINQNLADLYEEKSDFKKAFFYKTAADVIKDSINKIDIAKNTEDLLRKYETGKKEQEIAIKNIQINNAGKQKWYFIFGLLLLGIIGSLLFYQSRNRKKTNEKLQLLNTGLDEANKAKTRFFSILNHDLRGPVANLVFFLQLQKESPEMLDEESTKRMQDKTMAGAENLLNSMEDILQWSKSQMENFKPQPKNIAVSSLFEDTKTHFLSEEKIQITFENTQNVQINTDENYLKTIIRNLTGNAIKALNEIENPTIIWKTWQENGISYLSITDNGKGATDEQFKALYDEKEVVGIKSGLGLHLIRDLAKAIDCKIAVETHLNKGTTFVLSL
ncbi:tetratricopeptide repeat-containing sensor histidine kinase [Flavobacterium sp.]|uniref:tetratricopeptide repeat-containing sensor histidine kinase n=1 Tax=Flavobacterium sp. TaxID=239 RepID=UPI002610B844|nr:tetratricopeptide repeat-containing sensor histidine kinase [Flavobacterium sp.]